MARARLKAQEPVTTVGGVEVVIFSTEAHGKFPIVGQIIGAGRTAHEQWTPTGQAASGITFNQLKNGTPDPALVFKQRQPRTPKTEAPAAPASEAPVNS